MIIKVVVLVAEGGINGSVVWEAAVVSNKDVFLAGGGGDNACWEAAELSSGVVVPFGSGSLCESSGNR